MTRSDPGQDSEEAKNKKNRRKEAPCAMHPRITLLCLTLINKPKLLLKSCITLRILTMGIIWYIPYYTWVMQDVDHLPYLRGLHTKWRDAMLFQEGGIFGLSPGIPDIELRDVEGVGFRVC